MTAAHYPATCPTCAPPMATAAWRRGTHLAQQAHTSNTGTAGRPAAEDLPADTTPVPLVPLEQLVAQP